MYDISGINNTIRLIKQHIPHAHVIGAQLDQTQSILSLQVKDGYKIGIIGWTEVMNNDKKNNKKPIVRGEDINPALLESIKKKAGYNLLIGFPHGNEEQSYEPLKETRDRWMAITGPTMFDVIVGTGPHVVQPAEKRNGRLIFHSIGNFFSPKGRSQTKVGCVPELVIKTDLQHRMQALYSVHFLQQHEDTVSLFTLNDAGILYPEIADRLRNIWDPSIHAVNTSSHLKRICLVVGLSLSALYYVQVFS